jgi:hypothetical protein
MSEATRVLTPPSSQAAATVDRMVNLAVEGLMPMFDTSRQLFCYKLKKTDHGLIQEGISHRYTMMTLLGLHRYEQAGGTSPISIESVLNALLSDLNWIDDIGDLGVLLWLCGVVAPDRLARLEQQLPIANSLSTYPSAKKGVTMELAWFLTGLSYWVLAFPNQRPQLENLAVQTYERLKASQGERGFFGHLCSTSSFMGMVRGRIGSFADQVYPIYAMTHFSRAFCEGEATQRAMKCARGICDVQGSLGQWWWHYDSVSGMVAEGYPVFSVHQHAMGPMTLFALGEATGQDFNPWIYRGLQWINGENELRSNMEDDAANLIWRCQFRPKSRLMKYFSFAIADRKRKYQAASDLEVLYECRPYELGWLLYAFAGRKGKNLRLSAAPGFETHATVDFESNRV